MRPCPFHQLYGNCGHDCHANCSLCFRIKMQPFIVIRHEQVNVIKLAVISVQSSVVRPMSTLDTEHG
jgi:hypothetical protein